MIKKKRVIILALIIAIIISIAAFLSVRNNDSEAFSVAEKKWIDNNKSQVIDFAVLNDLPYFGVNGEGIFFDFIVDLEKTTGLKFNMISYNIGEKPLASDFSFEVKPKNSKNESSMYTDYYVVLGTKSIFNIAELKTEKVGILKDDINLGTYYLSGIALTSYATPAEIFEAFKTGEVNYVVIPYLPNIKTILENNYNVAYRLTDMANKYELTSNTKEDKLSSIVNKYFKTWMRESFAAQYKKTFTDFYFTNKKINEQTKSGLWSKKYVYGYVSNLPYEKIVNGQLVGINSEYISNFKALSDVDFVYKKYSSLKNLQAALKSGAVDMAFGYFDKTKLNAHETVSIYENKYVALAHVNNDLTIDSLRSLDDTKVSVIKDSLLHNHVKTTSKAKIKGYDTIDSLTNSMTKNSVIVIDWLTYDYYKKSKFSKFTVIHENVLNNGYTFLFSDKKTNDVLRNIFSYYIDTVNKTEYLNTGSNDLVKDNVDSSILNLVVKYIIYVSFSAVLLIYILYRIVVRKKVKKAIKKEDKIKFVDMLTSLKNRNYLNYNMDKWDANETYPQSIIIIDLNNVQYINDNFGHEEGDNTIVNAANILINNQLANSDIIRTDGNEFLVYLVGYKEDEIIAYIRKLNKEFKGLIHGFGASVGYSVIKDGITTIDDAINEATLDMRTNKEGIQD